jgi:hypothetical protein
MLHWRGKQHTKQQPPKPFIDLNWLIPLKFANLGLLYICEKVVIFFVLRLSISLESILLMNLSRVEKKQTFQVLGANFAIRIWCSTITMVSLFTFLLVQQSQGHGNSTI